MRGLLLVLLPGCGLFGGTLDRKTSCEHDVFGWWGGLTSYVDQGEADGQVIRFDLDPSANWMTRAWGEYDSVTGDFSYAQEYVPRHFIAEWEAEGYGTVYSTGDADLLIEVSWVDVLGDTFGYTLREERVGCEGELSTWAEDAQPQTSAYTIRSDDRVDTLVDLDTEDGGRWWERGSLYSGGRSTSQIDYDYVTGTYAAARETAATGDWEESFAQLGPDMDYVGTRSGNISGDLVQRYVISEHEGDELGEYFSNQAYDGSGWGTWLDYASDEECALDFDAGGDCTYECGDGSSGSC